VEVFTQFEIFTSTITWLQSTENLVSSIILTVDDILVDINNRISLILAVTIETINGSTPLKASNMYLSNQWQVTSLTQGCTNNEQKECPQIFTITTKNPIDGLYFGGAYQFVWDLEEVSGDNHTAIFIDRLNGSVTIGNWTLDEASAVDLPPPVVQLVVHNNLLWILLGIGIGLVVLAPIIAYLATRTKIFVLTPESADLESILQTYNEMGSQAAFGKGIDPNKLTSNAFTLYRVKGPNKMALSTKNVLKASQRGAPPIKIEMSDLQAIGSQGVIKPEIGRSRILGSSYADMEISEIDELMQYLGALKLSKSSRIPVNDHLAVNNNFLGAPNNLPNARRLEAVRNHRSKENLMKNDNQLSPRGMEREPSRKNIEREPSRKNFEREPSRKNLDREPSRRDMDREPIRQNLHSKASIGRPIPRDRSFSQRVPSSHDIRSKQTFRREGESTSSASLEDVSEDERSSDEYR